MADIELKTCPCCGGRAMAWYDIPFTSNEIGVGGFRVECVECHLKTTMFRTKKEAIESWNERSTPDDIMRCGECIHRIERFRQSCIGRPKDWFCADGIRGR